MNKISHNLLSLIATYILKPTVSQLIPTAWRLVRKEQLFTTFVICTIFNIAIMILPSYIKSLIGSDVTNMCYYVVAIELLSLIVEKIDGVITERLLNSVEKQFNTESWDKYDKLSWSSKNKRPVEQFNAIKNQGCWPVIQLISNGLSTISSFVSSFIGCCLILIKNDGLTLMLSIIVVNIFSYCVVTKKLQSYLNNARKESAQIFKRNNDKKQLLLPLFQQNRKSVNDISMLENQIVDGWAKSNIIWNNISIITIFTNRLALIWFLFQTDMTSVKFLLLYSASTSMNSSIVRLMSFLNNYTEMQTKFDTFDKNLDGLELMVPTIQYDLPYGGLVVENIDYLNEKFRIRGPGFSIKTGTDTLIKGGSGFGKTTLLRLLSGSLKVSQPIFANTKLNPINFLSKFAVLFQGISSKLPTSTITIREIFEDEPCDKTLDYYIKFVELDGWVNNLSPVSSSNSFVTGSNYDVEINERISGGQKSRLALAYQLYLLIKNRNEVFFPDELLQDLDPEQAYHIVKKILTEFKELYFEKIGKELTIVMISHLESIVKIHKWDQIIVFGSVGNYALA